MITTPMRAQFTFLCDMKLLRTPLTNYFHSWLTKRLLTENVSWTSQNVFMLLIRRTGGTVLGESFIHDSLQKVSD